MPADVVYIIDVDEKGAVQGVRRLGREFKSLERETGDVQREFKSLERETDDTRRSFNRLEQVLEKVKKDLLGVDKSTRNAGKGFGSLGRLLKGAGIAASASGLGYLAFEASRSAREATILADAIGIGAGQVRGLSIAMEKVGGDIRGVRGILVTTADAVSEFEDGTGRVVEQMGKLGLTVDDFEGKDIYGQFTTIAEAVEDFGGSTAEAIGILSNLYEREDAARIAAIGNDFEDVGDAGTEALGKVAEAWDTLKEEFSKGIIGVATVTFEVISGESTDGSSTGVPGSATGVQLPTFDPTANVINPVTGEFVSLGPLQTPSHLDPRARGLVTPTQMLSGGLQTGSAQDVRARGAITAAELFRGFIRNIPGGTTGGGGGRTPIDRSPEISAAAFARATEQGLERALRNALQSEDFNLARDEAEALHDLRTIAAQSLETAGEQFLAQQQADFALLDTLAEIGASEEEYNEAILEELTKQSKELAQVRDNTRSAKQIAIDTARQAFAGTDLAQPFENIITGEESVNQALILQAASLLSGFEQDGDFTSALLGFRQIPGSDAGVDDYGNADALGILFTRAIEAIVADDTNNIFGEAGGLFSRFGLGDFGNLPEDITAPPIPVVEIQTIPIQITVEVPPVPLGDSIQFVEDVVREALVTHTVRV